MEPISLIMASLAAGAVAGAEGTASQAVKDAYAGLKALVKRCLSGRSAGETALEQHEKRPTSWQGALEAELVDADASQDPAMVRAAQQLMALLDADGSRAGKYQVDVHGSQGVQIGDFGTQTNTFGTPPSV